MERLRQVFYRPYNGRVHPRYACFARSQISNPLQNNFHSHLTRTHQALDNLRQKRLQGTSVFELEGAYYNRPWFIKTSAVIDHLVDRIRQFRMSELEPAEFRRYTVLMATLEIVCSLVLFCDSDYYRAMTDEDIEWFHFPLSKWSRTIISSLKIEGDNLLVSSTLLQWKHITCTAV